MKNKNKEFLRQFKERLVGTLEKQTSLTNLHRNMVLN